jgi:peptide-methionine (R)-S-oxide reductase
MARFILFLVSFAIVCLACKSSKNNQSAVTNSESKGNASDKSLPYFVNVRGDTIKKVVLTDEQWKQKLNEMEFYVLRQKGTERAFTGDLLQNKSEGIYTCRGCGAPLFASKHKFESGTGWPSFYDVIEKSALTLDTDYDLGYARTELTCTKCGGHQGHVFPDGPKPTGLRYCINAVSLDFVKTENGK